MPGSKRWSVATDFAVVCISILDPFASPLVTYCRQELRRQSIQKHFFVAPRKNSVSVGDYWRELSNSVTWFSPPALYRRAILHRIITILWRSLAHENITITLVIKLCEIMTSAVI